MSKTVFRLVLGISFVALLPLSWRVADALFFTHPFNSSLFDPVLEICSDRLQILSLRELASNGSPSPVVGCTFQVASEQQHGIEEAVQRLRSPAPGKSSWVMRTTQLGGNHQRIHLKLVGDGAAGMIYEVQNSKITPLKSTLTGPLGAVFPIIVNVALWFLIWLGLKALLNWRNRPV